MTVQTQAPEPFLSRAELHEWLADEDWYPSAHTREWLKRTPRDEAAPILAELAREANLEPLNPWALFVMVGVMGGFVPSQGAAGRKVLDRKAGIRAALYLADFNDVRAIAPLCRLWTSHPFRKSKYHDRIETDLTNLLSQNANTAAPDDTRAAVRDLVARVWNARGANRDLSPKEADLLIAALHFLGGDASTLGLSAQSRLEQRARVQEAARGAVNP